MRFAITDIETTGSYASENSIIEIAICLVENGEIIEEFQTFLNPHKKLSSFITGLTGINDAMLRNAPDFEDVSDEIQELFKDAVFVAHNVNFDYSFFKAEFAALGVDFQPPRLCTVKLARKAFPGKISYGLGSMCKDLNIYNSAPHRAMGDARATVELFFKALPLVTEDDFKKLLGKKNVENFLPNHIEKNNYDLLPEATGVYYFLDKKNQPVYIGKAKNIKKRVKSHFSGNLESAKAQGFIKEIYAIDFKTTHDELIALLLEDAEIRKHWPKYNKAQKNRIQRYDIIHYTDQRGYLRLALNKGSNAGSLKSFTSSFIAKSWLIDTAERFQIDLRLWGIHSGLETDELPNVDSYNERMKEVLQTIEKERATFLLHKEYSPSPITSFILVEKDIVKGFGTIDTLEESISSIDQLLSIITPIPSTEVNQSLILSYLEQPRGWKIKKIVN